MRQRILTAATSALREMSAGSVERKYLVGSGSPLGHSMSSHSSSRGTLRRVSRWAALTRTAAKREESLVLVPSRQVSLRQAADLSDSASAFTATGGCVAARRSRVGLRPRPDQGLGGSAPVPGAQTVVAGLMPTT